MCFLYVSEACIRIRVKGEEAPELLLELQDDDRTQTFLTHVKSAQEHGKTPQLMTGLKQLIHYLITPLIFICRVWISPLAHFLSSSHPHAGGNSHFLSILFSHTTEELLFNLFYQQVTCSLLFSFL